MSRTSLSGPSLAVVCAVLLVAGLAGGWWLARRTAPSAPAMSASADTPKNAGEVLYWYDPMKPEQHFDKPGKSPFMDMQLVPRYAQSAAVDSVVEVSAAAKQSLGMRLAKVQRRTLEASVEASGVLGYNERDVAVVQARAAGIVARAWPLAPGDRVAAGAPLVELLVPEWSAAQHEFLAARAAGDASLVEAARARLHLLGLDEAQIRTLEREGTAQDRFIVRAPLGGVVDALEIRAGMSVVAGQTLLRINGLGDVWLEVAVPEAMAGAIQVGASAAVRLASTPDRPLEGHVTAVLPALNATTRSLRVRIALPNPNGALRPGQSAQVALHGVAQAPVLVVPTEAVIRTGKRTLVMVAEQDGYRPVEVMLGRENGDSTEIVSGLEEGQQVVASGQFLLDSEASLRGMTGGAEEQVK